MSDHEILAALQTGAGGSFRSFFSSLFGKSRQGDGVGSYTEAEEPVEPNPFTEAKQESLADSLAAESLDTPQTAKAEPTASQVENQPAESESAPAATAVSAISAGASWRSSLVLRVGDDGTLQAIPATQIADGAFETTQMGVLNFEMLSFSDSADAPASIAVADFNNDGLPDVAYHYAPSGLIRFFYGNSEGAFQEGLRIETGPGPRSLAAGDFNGDGKTDVAISNVGTGGIEVLYREDGAAYRFTTYWVESYRDYITAGGAASPGVIGMSFGNTGTMLLDFSQNGADPGAASFSFSSALDAKLPNSQGGSTGLNAVLVGSSLSLNLTNRLRQLSNVLYVAPYSNVYIVVGDLDNNGRITIGIGAYHP